MAATALLRGLMMAVSIVCGGTQPVSTCWYPAALTHVCTCGTSGTPNSLCSRFKATPSCQGEEGLPEHAS